MRGVTCGALLVLSLAIAAGACGQSYDGVVPDAGLDAGIVGTSPTPGGVDADVAVTPGPVLDDSYTEGSRLKPSFFTVGSTKVFVDWWDAKLSVHCTFKPSAAGEYRCIPNVPKADPKNPYFSNSACTRSLLYLRRGGPCTTAPTLLDIGDDCSPHIVKVGALAVDQWSMIGGTCTKATEPPTNNYAQLSDLAVTDMVRGTIEDGSEDLGGPLKAKYVRGDDGAYGFFRLEPKAFATACVFGTSGTDTSLHCYPTATLSADIGSFTDSACTIPLFTGGTCSGAAAPAVGRTSVASTDACNPTAVGGDFYALGANYSGQIWRPNGTMCAVIGSVGGGGPAGAGKIDPATDFGTATRLQVQGDAGLEIVYAMMPSGHRTKVRWFDPAHDTDCALAPASDGSWRCLPLGAGAARSMFSDSDCKVAKVAAYVAAPGVEACRFSDDRFGGRSCPSRCTLPATPKLASLEGAAPVCSLLPAQQHIYRVGALAGGYAQSGGPIVSGPGGIPTCNALTRTDEAVYDAEEISAADFVQATLSFP